MIEAALLLSLGVSGAHAQGMLYKRKPKPTEEEVAQAPAISGGMLNLSCLNALVSVGQAELAGVFSFITEKDSGLAFADFIARNRAALKKYLVKLDNDIKVASGVTPWDHEVVVQVIELYQSPLAETFEKMPPEIGKRLTKFSMAPTITLEEQTQRKAAARK
jgi:hypothetical protein